MKHSVGKLLAAGATTTLFTVPAGYKAEVSLLFISNHSGNNKTIGAYWQHAHDIDHKIIIMEDNNLDARDFIQFAGASIIMQAGDSIVLTTEAGSAMSAICTFDLKKEPQTVAFEGE
jgi:hypothetical protein